MPHANVVTMVIDGNSLGVQGDQICCCNGYVKCYNCAYPARLSWSRAPKMLKSLLDVLQE